MPSITEAENHLLWSIIFAFRGVFAYTEGWYREVAVKKTVAFLMFLLITFGLFALDADEIQKKIVGGNWVQKQPAYNQVFYYAFYANKTGFVYYTQNGKKIGEYKITYRIEDTYLILETPGGEIIWEIKAITNTILVRKDPASDQAVTLRRQ